MIEKLLRAAVISVAATAATVWLLRRSEAKRALPPPSGEVDAERLPEAQKDALLAELEAQL